MKISAGLLLYRFRNQEAQFFLVHPGGPFWKKKDRNVWSIPKGEIEKDENYLEAAIRETKEETGINIDFTHRELFRLTPIKPYSSKIIYAWAAEADFDPSKIKSNLFEIEWPPKSGKKHSFPEVDKAGWFNLAEAKEKVLTGQFPLLEESAKYIKL